MSLAYKTNRIERCCTFSVPIIRNFFCENVTYNLLQKVPWNWTFNWYLVTTNVLSRYNMYKRQSDLKFDPICRSCHTSDSHDMSLWHKWYGVYRIWCEKEKFAVFQLIFKLWSTLSVFREAISKMAGSKNSWIEMCQKDFF